MTDYIRRKAAIAVFGDAHPLDYNAQAYRHGIETIPAADVRENKRGKWVWNDQSKLVCNLCGNVIAFVSHPKKKWEAGYFCPNCGASMLSGEEQT